MNDAQPASAVLREWCCAALLLTIGLGFAAGLHSGAMPPIDVSVMISLVVVAWGLYSARTSPGSLLPRFMLLVYALPFSALIGYIGNPGFQWVFTRRGYVVGQDVLVMQILGVTGLVGALGFVAGIHLANARRRTVPPPGRTTASASSIGLPAYAIALAGAVALSWLSTPPETIVQGGYAHEQSLATSRAVNFSAAFLVSYVLFVLLWIDAEREKDRSRRMLKLVTFGAGVAYVILVLQMLRGDRESSGLIVALAALYVTQPTGLARVWPTGAQVRRRIRRLFPAVALVAAVFVALGEARSRFKEVVATLTPTQLLRVGWSQNTWTAVLWRNLGVAWEYRNGVIEYKWGSTYRDYALSLPPGFITQAVGYERPVESWKGIAWEDPAGVSAGGLHIVIPPFKNFGAPGVLFILCGIGFGIGVLDVVSHRGRFVWRLLWGSVFTSGFLWFWYGDMTFIRAVMATAIVFYLYRLALGLPRLSGARARPELFAGQPAT